MFYSARKEESKDLAFSIQKSISDTLQKDNDRKIKQGTSDTFLLHKATIPAVIVECGFLSNPQELSAFKTEDYQMQMAVAIATGILNYMGSENNGNKK